MNGFGATENTKMIISEDDTFRITRVKSLLPFRVLELCLEVEKVSIIKASHVFVVNGVTFTRNLKVSFEFFGIGCI